jgi:phage FluMu protein Com
MGLAMPRHVATFCKSLCSRVWAEIDVVPLVLPECKMMNGFTLLQPATTYAWDSKTLDEQAESMSRKSVRFVGSATLWIADADPCADCLVRKTSPYCRSV